MPFERPARAARRGPRRRAGERVRRAGDRAARLRLAGAGLHGEAAGRHAGRPQGAPPGHRAGDRGGPAPARPARRPGGVAPAGVAPLPPARSGAPVPAFAACASSTSRPNAATPSAIAGNFAGHPEIVVPKVHWQWTSERLNVQDRVTGIAGRNLAALDEDGLRPQAARPPRRQRGAQDDAGGRLLPRRPASRQRLLPARQPHLADRLRHGRAAFRGAPLPGRDADEGPGRTGFRRRHRRSCCDGPAAIPRSTRRSCRAASTTTSTSSTASRWASSISPPC